MLDALDERANYSLEDMDRNSLFHPLTSIATHMDKGPAIMDGAKGARLRDHSGNELVDCSGGLWCVNIGYGRPEIAEAAKQAVLDLNYWHLFGSASNEATIRLADKVLNLFHEHANARHLKRVFFGTSGSDANDTNYKLVRYYANLRGKPEKCKIISRQGAYHGLTAAAATLTGISSYHKAWSLPDTGVIHTSCPHYFRFAEDGESEEAFTDRMIAEIAAIIEREGPETIGAFIAEPIMGTGGVLMPPKGYFAKLQPLLDQHDILLIADEVITGFGRTGQWFGTGLYELKPDIVTLAKGITSAYFPVSASVISERIWNVLEHASPEYGPVMHGFTYSGHPVGAAVGLANIAILENENMVSNAATVGAYLLDGLKSRLAEHPYVGEVRGAGLMIGVEFTADRARRTPFHAASNVHRLVAGKAVDHGLMVRALPFIEVVSFSPPLCITKAECDLAVDRFAAAIDDLTPKMTELAKAS
ncbi:MAG TPA: aminotransferase [Geminicoccus sp.]|uniref:aminotransferase n=1 Tax=Geminicoccus sp. TaxID=2024832 RepID=UPI002CEAA2EB|nr:aminotransferase [Geminicoccus sp.]HWL70783.1 aminotransferase [Geminicoccus sp.]